MVDVEGRKEERRGLGQVEEMTGRDIRRGGKGQRKKG